MYKSINSGVNIIDLCEGIESVQDEVIEYLKSCVKPVSGSDAIRNVATVSANGDTHIGGLITEAFDRIGKYGVITVETGKSAETELDVVEGMQFDSGFISPIFANTDKLTCELSDPYVLIYDKSINHPKSIMHILDAVAKSQRSLVMICDDVEGVALQILAVNASNQVLKVCPVKAPGFGNHRKNMLEDLAILTGAKVISEDLGRSLESVTIEDLGQAKSICVSKNKTILAGGAGSKDLIQQRCDLIQNLLDDKSLSTYEKEQLQERRAKLSQGVAVIKVGGMTETAQQETKDRVDDAVQAVHAAIKSGTLPGGGVSLVHAHTHISKSTKTGSSAFELGRKILKEALFAPLKQNLVNAGYENSSSREPVSVIIHNIRNHTSASYGFDIRNGQYGDMYEMRILDSFDGVQYSLKYAVAGALDLLKSGGLVIDEVIPQAKL